MSPPSSSRRPYLGAEIIAFLMQPNGDGRHFEQFIALMRNYLHGNGGQFSPTLARSQEGRHSTESLQ